MTNMFKLFRRKKVTNVNQENNNNILLNYPSVDVYKDRKTSVIYLNPSVIHPIGARSTNKKYIKLEPPFDEHAVGKAIKEAIQISDEEPYLPEGVKGDFWLDVKGVKSMTSFLRSKLLIIVTQNKKENNFRIIFMKKYKTTGYTHSKNDPEITVLVTIDEFELGKIVLQGFSKCT